jgi:hypothetical protein
VVPKELGGLLQHPDKVRFSSLRLFLFSSHSKLQETRERVLKNMLKMKKIEVAKLTEECDDCSASDCIA